MLESLKGYKWLFCLSFCRWIRITQNCVKCYIVCSTIDIDLIVCCLVFALTAVCNLSWFCSVTILSTAWLLAVQIMMTLALIQQMVTIVFSICYFSQTCPPPKERSWIRVCCILNFIGGEFQMSFIHPMSVAGIRLCVGLNSMCQW